MAIIKIYTTCGLIFAGEKCRCDRTVKSNHCAGCSLTHCNRSTSYPFKCPRTSLCLVHVDKKQICNHLGGCYVGECDKYLEAEDKHKLNEALG